MRAAGQTIDPVLLEVLEGLEDHGMSEAEVCAKQGRNRQLSRMADQEALRQSVERGWAVRAGDDRRSMHFAATGPPTPSQAWPEADGRGLRLPSARPLPGWRPPAVLDAPLLGESEMRGVAELLEKALDQELPSARLQRVVIEDGASEQQLASSRGIRAKVRQRAASLFVEAIGADGRSASVLAAESDARRFDPRAIVQRLADTLTIRQRGKTPPSRDRGEFLLAPDIGCQLLAALSSLWLGPSAIERAKALTLPDGRLASRAVTLVDDGRLAGGVLDAPCDGEGQPTGRSVIVERGVYRQPVLAWWQTDMRQRAVGCGRRASWRDLPRPALSHCHLEADRAVSVADLLTSLSRGYYLIALDGAIRIDDRSGRFMVPVSGFAIHGGRPTDAISGGWLTGTLSTLLSGIVQTARDLRFSAISGSMYGAPTLLVKGLELRASP